MACRVLAAACSCLCAAPALADLDDIRFRVSADVAYDDNVSRGREDDRLDDTFATLSVGASVPLEMGTNARLVLAASGGAERFNRYRGLDRLFGDIQAELQYRGSGDFAEPIWGLFVRSTVERYDSSNLRDGFRYSAGASVRWPATDRVFFFGAIAYNERDGSSAVFDTQDVSIRGHLDFSLTGRQTLYVGLEARNGDFVSTARPELEYLNIAEAVVVDDVFTDVQRFSYRIRANIGILTLGYNIALGERAALDIAYRGAYARPEEQPTSVTSEKLYYTVNQASASLLFRF
jgi:hypothetical protein